MPDDMGRAVEFYNSGEFRKSAHLCSQILSTEPDNPDALHLLALIAHRMGQNEAAIALIQKCLSIKEDVPAYHFTAADICNALNKPDIAITFYNRAIELNPEFYEAYNNLGVLLIDQGRLDEALRLLRRAVTLKNDFYEAHNNLGNVLCRLGKVDEAIARNRQAVALKPDSFRALNNLGVMLMAQGELDESVAVFNRAVSLEPDYYEAHNNLGNVLCRMRKIDEAITCYRRALDLKGDYPDAYNNLGNALAKIGKIDEARTCYRKAFDINHNDGILIKMATLLPPVMMGSEDISHYRKRIDQAIDDFLESGVVLKDPSKDVGQTNFYLAYHGLNNLEFHRKIARLYMEACPSLLYTAPHCTKKKAAAQHSKIKVGFISSNFYNLAIGKHFRGVITNLARDLFEVCVFWGRRKSDDIAKFIKANADTSVLLASDLDIARKQIAEYELDILLYTDIGMDPLTYFLAFSRLAPVQCVTWGHPDTTGIPNMDYYISCEDFEPEGSETQYSESLVKFNNIPNYFYRPENVEMNRFREIRERLGVKSGHRLYVVPQSLFKLHPDFDAVLGEILRRDRDGLLVLFETSEKSLGALLMERFQRSITDVKERIVILPRLPLNDFLVFVGNADAVLDTPYFCGGTTSLEMFSVGCPIVTWPGSRMSSRFTYAYYRKMDIPDLACHDSEEYIRKALRLSSDQSWRSSIRKNILDRHGVLYENQDAIKEFEQFFVSACANR